jgi:hypothetical protein
VRIDASRIPSHSAWRDDNAGVVIDDAVVGDQRRNLAERILLPQRVGQIGRIGGLDPYLLVKAEKRDRNPHLAGERRSGGRTQNHHCHTIPRSCPE